jgi:signal transduction histidine kinase
MNPPVSPNMTPVGIIDEMKEIPGMLVFITNADGSPIFASQEFGNNTAMTRLFSQYQQQKTQLITSFKVGALQFRFIVLPAVNQEGVSHIVMVGHPVDVIESSLRSLTTSLGLIFLSLILPTIAGGYFLAGSALRPIGDLGEEMEKLSVENLNRRIQNPGTGDEVDTLTNAFNSLLDRLENSFRTQRQFIGDVAHEMKTPLATQRSSIDVALSRPRSKEELEKILQGLRVDNDRVSQTLTNLLDLAWSQADAVQNRLEPISVSQLSRELLEIGQNLAYEKKIQLHARVEDGVIVPGKKDKLFRALLNLVENAVKYTPKKGKITITVKKSDTEAHITVKDTGIGIPPQDVPHIFDRFYRGSKTDKTTGSGLGLSITHGIITALGGTITVESEPDHGATFRITLPLA